MAFSVTNTWTTEGLDYEDLNQNFEDIENELNGTTTDNIFQTTIMSPIGAVVAWLKSLTGTPATLPAGWVECNGQTISDEDSVYDGVTIPDLNASAGTARFLRGGTTSGAEGGSETHGHQWNTRLNNNGVTIQTEGLSGSASDAGAGYNSSGTEQNWTDSNGALNKNTGNYTSHSSTLPSYYTVVWIMRIK
jgi:hypothetical protein